MLSNKQKAALEKITGKYWYLWNEEAVVAYFMFTDKGKKVKISDEAKPDFDKIMEFHHWHSVTVELWKKDFKIGLLFLSDFIGEDVPLTYTKHVFEIYESVFGYIPSCYK